MFAFFILALLWRTENAMKVYAQFLMPLSHFPVDDERPTKLAIKGKSQWKSEGKRNK
jgi:hypothetical protein